MLGGFSFRFRSGEFWAGCFPDKSEKSGVVWAVEALQTVIHLRDFCNRLVHSTSHSSFVCESVWEGMSVCYFVGLTWSQLFLSIPVLLGRDIQTTYCRSDHFSTACVTVFITSSPRHVCVMMNSLIYFCVTVYFTILNTALERKQIKLKLQWHSISGDKKNTIKCTGNIRFSFILKGHTCIRWNMENVGSVFQNENIDISSSAFRGSGHIVVSCFCIVCSIFLHCWLKHAARLFFSHFNWLCMTANDGQCLF